MCKNHSFLQSVHKMRVSGQVKNNRRARSSVCPLEGTVCLNHRQFKAYGVLSVDMESCVPYSELPTVSKNVPTIFTRVDVPVSDQPLSTRTSQKEKLTETTLQSPAVESLSHFVCFAPFFRGAPHGWQGQESTYPRTYPHGQIRRFVHTAHGFRIPRDDGTLHSAGIIHGIMGGNALF